MTNTNIAMLRRLATGGMIIAFACAAPTFAAPAEDQWYDPTDWFDGNNIESDDTLNSYYDYTYPYRYDHDWDRYSVWGDDIWGQDYYDSEYWDDYSWSDNTSSASSMASSSGGKAGQKKKSGTSSGQSGSTAAQSGSSSSKSGSSTADGAVVYTYVLVAEPVGSTQQGSSGQKGSQQKSGTGKQSSQIARVNGTIEGLQQMNLRRESGATGLHTIARIKLQNGKSTVVSLGRSSQIEKLNLKAGDSIQAVGSKGMIDGETVFVAKSLKANGQTVAANPAIRLNRSQMSQTPSAPQGNQNQSQAGSMTGGSAGQQTLSGEVASINRSTAGQGKNQHTLVDVKLENGKSATLDFGPGASVDKIGLDEGDRITARGRSRQVQGKEVLSVDLLKIDGQKISSVSK